MTTNDRENIHGRIYGLGRAVPDLDTMNSARRVYLTRFMAHYLAGQRMSQHGCGVYARA
jgi:hypothetical protein